MNFLNRLFAKTEAKSLRPLDAGDEDIVAVAAGEMIDVRTLPDPMFAEEMLGKSVAFHYNTDSVIICSPANGKIAAMFPTGHAFGVETKEGVQILVHVGIDTVNANGDGFILFDKRIGDEVKAGEPIVRADLKKMSEKYDMSTILIITDANGKEIEFIENQPVKRGTSLLKKNA